MAGFDPGARARFLRRLRTLHGWLGLWGAVMGLAFGATGILLNHRNLLKLPVELVEKASVPLAVPDAARTSPEALAAWLQAEHGAPTTTPVRIRTEPATTVQFDGRPVAIPARWTLTFHAPDRQYGADYWAGSGEVKLEKQDASLLGTLTRLHKGYGINALWVLLIDAFAGALILLSLTGLTLWTRLERPRLAGLGLAFTLPALAGAWYLAYA